MKRKTTLTTPPPPHGRRCGLFTFPQQELGREQFYVLLGSAGFWDGQYHGLRQGNDGKDVVEKDVDKGDKIEKVV
jgi:hypothetical protein